MPWGRHLGGGVPISHNALQDYPEFHGADTWGYPARSSRGGTLQGRGTLPGGYPAQGVPCWGVPARGYPAGGTLPRGVFCQGYPAQGVPCWGYPAQGVPCWGSTLPGGTQVGYHPSQVRTGEYPPQARSGWGGTQLEQQKEYSLHSGRYASCVHAGGLSCLRNQFEMGKMHG